MLLTSIVIQGFKSFADKTVLKFGKGITAVVGPNGSGKSNISDAVRWVLGEQSTKSLRGQSMEDVIFGGTESRRPHGFCEVTLNIDNSDRSLNFDNDSVSVTRRFYRSHESEYLINNVSVRLKDVHELFMDTGLGRDGYSMIGQGKIDNIISSKSDERRDIFEEASGISKYRYRKTEAERKLAAAEDNLLRLKDIMQELESRVGPLKIQSEKAEKFLDLAEQKKQLQIGLWLYTLDNSKDALRAQESKIDAAQIKYKEIEEKLTDFDLQNERNTRIFASITTDIEENRNKISLLDQENIRISGEITLSENEITHNDESIVRLNEEKAGLDSSAALALKDIEEKRKSAEEKKKEAVTLGEELTVLENQLANLLNDSENISRKIEEQIKLLNELSGEISDCRVTLSTATTTINEINSRAQTVDALINDAKENKEKLNTDLGETKDLFKKTEDDILSLTNSVKGYELRLNSKSEEAEKIKQQCEELHLELETKKRRAELLKELENNMEGFSKAVVRIVEESKKGILKGVHGPVSKLITVDKKYTVAIETALGNNIQNVVVDTENDAKRAINYLKSNNAGRATFMPVSSVRSREFKESGFEDVYGFVGIASDLVKVDSKYDEIIKYLLGGAVVTEDIDTAVTLAKKYNYRVKVVSLDGQVVNPGGSLTGGSLVKHAGILSRTADIKRLDEEINKLTGKEKTLISDLNEKNSDLAKINADIVAVKADLTSANEDRIRILAELKHFEELINANEQTLKSLTEEKENGDKKIALLKENAEKTEKRITELNTNKDNIQSEIDQMTGGRDNISEKRESLTNDITELKLQIINKQKDAESLLINATEIENSIQNRNTRAGEIDNEISAIKFKTEQIKTEIADKKDEIENNKQQQEIIQKTISELQFKRNETEKAGVMLRQSERDETLEREKIGGELARLTERKEVMLKEYDEVISKLYDEYSLTKSEAESIAKRIDKPAEAKKNLSDIKSKIRDLGAINVSAIEEYKEVKERYDFMSEQIADVENSRIELHKLINELTAQMQELFIIGFNRINENFSKTFRDLFGGGTASLRLTDSENILQSGIDIEARLPGKNVPSLDGLSGGEKALVALSIYFAIMQVSAPPFCFLDEVDTALDDINVERFAEYMKKTDYNTQFICVTHRRGTMEAADMLYGVTMQEKGVTKLLELNVSELEKKLLESKGA